MTRQPYTFQVTAVTSGRMLIFAADIEEAYDILQDRTDELVDDLAATAALPDNPYILYSLDVRPATGAEVATATDGHLTPGLLTVDRCDCCDTHPTEEPA